jgi:hypothetical protein
MPLDAVSSIQHGPSSPAALCGCRVIGSNTSSPSSFTCQRGVPSRAAADSDSEQPGRRMDFSVTLRPPGRDGGTFGRARVGLHGAMLAGGIFNVELRRRLGLDKKAVRRLRDPLHRSHIGQIEAALRLLGKRLEVRVLAAV